MPLTRDELHERLQDLIIQCTRHSTIICPRCEERLERVMDLIDEYAAPPPETEQWTAGEVAEYIGLKDANAGRSWLSRAGIESTGQRRHPHSGRMLSLYPANHVRAEHFRKVSS